MYKIYEEKYMNTELQTVEENGVIIPNEKDLKNASAILSLLHGKADSNCKIYKKPILVDKDGLQTLHQEILDKLQLHQVGDVVTSIDVSFSNRHFLSFKSWADFSAYNFGTENSKIQSVVMQWDFFIKLDHYQMPQRHTLNVRIASTPKPSDIFKVLLSGGFDEEHDIDIQGSTMIARVDFINSTLAEELLNVVSKWNELCDVAYTTRSKFRKFLYVSKTFFANLTEFFAMVSLVALLGIAVKLTNLVDVFSTVNANLIFAILALIPISNLFKDIGRFFGKKIYDKLDDVMEIHVFSISKGDKKAIDKIKRSSEYKKEVVIFVLNIVASVILSVIFFLIDK